MQDYSPLHYWTPTLESLPLKQKLGKTIWLKMECYQPTGSFKIRGIGRLCRYWMIKGKTHFVSSSGGNAGIAVAYAGKKFGIKVTVFIPSTSKQIFIDILKQLGAEVKIAGNVWDEAHAAASLFAEEINGAYIPPFDHPLLWSGHATMINEVADLGIVPDAVVAAVGGGGLACGILEGMHQHGWYDIPFYGVETEGAASFAASLQAHQLVTLPEIKTIATSLGAKRITEKLLDWTRIHPIFSLTVTDLEAAKACAAFVNDHRALVEPSSGAALAALYNLKPELANYNSILMIVCGGVGISLDLLYEYLKTAS